ncbi:MAG: ABC transporter substrate-binding protein [Spirochaetes bacterium]|nr:ABC transporter substrate-binding protein [Spirochaetota bacterium]
MASLPASPFRFCFTLLAFALLASCELSRPHPVAEAGKPVFYTSFFQLPKHFDIARAYSSDEYQVLALVIEPPVEFHYLKRPFELSPLAARELPTFAYYDAAGRPLPGDPPADLVARAVLRVRLKTNLFYGEHPAFVRTADGRARFASLSDRDLDGAKRPLDLPAAATRPAVAADFVYQWKRLAHPLFESPLASTLADVVEGFTACREVIQAAVDGERARRKTQGGALYDRAKDEREHPLLIDLEKIPFSGVRVLSEFEFEIVLVKKYPQLLQWMTLPFFGPVPAEVERFYAQGALSRKDISLDRWPVGTGPYRLVRAERNRQIAMEKNAHYVHGTYPTEGAPGDRGAGLLADAGKALPFIDRVVLCYEKESLPRWNKFLQGWYDASGITEDSFDAVIKPGRGKPELGGEPAAKGMSLLLEPDSSVHYWSFNMRDPVVGGLDEKRKKLRRAIAIAFDVEEYLQIFLNGRGVPAMSPLVPGVPGYEEGDVNPMVYRPGPKGAQRRSLDEAKALLAEAGYPGGVGPEGPLVLSFDGANAGQTGFQSEMNWMTKQMAKLGIQLRFRNTTYRQFREKMEKGTSQFFSWGWNADYPDAENLFFLLYGPNAMAGGGGENAANYESAAFDRGFEKMRVMTDGPERRAVIADLVRIAWEDGPWIWGFHPVTYALVQPWLSNIKPASFINSGRKYQRLEPALREAKRHEWNRPALWPLLLGLAALLGGGLWVWRRRRADAAWRAKGNARA